MTQEKSCGVILFREEKDALKVLLIQNHFGIYGFPKGHVEGNESEVETARREVEEEVGVTAILIDGFRMTETYLVSEKPEIHKEVVYFFGTFLETSFRTDEREVAAVALVNFEEALTKLDSPRKRLILKEAKKYYEKMIENKKEK